MKKTIFPFVAALLVAFSAAGQAQDVTVRAIGYAKSYRAAVNEALISALEQHEGITMNTSERQSITHDSGSVTTRINGALDDQSKLVMNDAIKSEMQKWANGKILGYTVVSDVFDATSGHYRVEVDARFKGEYIVGRNPDNLRRMAVSVFRLGTGDTFRWNGAADSAAAWAQGLAGRINERLTQTRKFTVVDRKFDAEIDAELKRITAANASAADVGRLNRKLATDYLVVGEVNFYTVQPPVVNPLTGQTMPPVNQKFADVSYRVLLAPTGQLKWSDTITINSFDFPAANISSFATESADGVAMRIVDGIMDNILPLEVVGKTPSGLIVIGEGGKSVAVGEVFTVYALGEEVCDSRTGEVLDEIEEAVGDVRIVRVTPKTSYAEVIGGNAALMVNGSRLRRPVTPAETPEPAARPVPTTIRGAGNGGFIAPF